MQQLETNAKEMDNICEELQHMEEGIEDEYDSFSNRLNTQRRQQQEENAKDVLKNAKSIDEARRIAAEREAAALAAQKNAEANMSEPKKIINQLVTKASQIIPPQNQQTPVSMSVTIDPNNKVAAATGKLTPGVNTVPSSVKASISMTEMNNNKSKSPNNFKLPEDDEFNRFLEDPLKSGSSQATTPSGLGATTIAAAVADEDDDEDNANPMVAALKETLDSSDEDLSSMNRKLANIPANLDNK